jgi:hypothetical protein
LHANRARRNGTRDRITNDQLVSLSPVFRKLAF